MLRIVPPAPRKIDTATIERRLRAEGFPIDRRSIQRDLQKLSTVFPIVCDDAHKPYGWSWMEGRGFSDDEASIAPPRTGKPDGRGSTDLDGFVVRLRVRDRARVLRDAPLRDARRVGGDGDGRQVVEAHAVDDTELRSWILAQGALVEVVEPKRLRNEIAAVLEEAARLYGSRDGRGSRSG
jgi:predicted DNA-binding transcriptional regulator YafY